MSEEQNAKKFSAFERLNSINVNEKTETKDTGRVKLTYLSWAWAWAEAKKMFPDLKVKVHENEQGLPYFASNEGIMVKVDVEIENISHTVYLPVMDGANNAMKTESYTFSTKYGEKEVKAATMMDINKAIQRATVKALGLHGLGLYIYAGEDLPEGEEAESPVKKKAKSTTSKTSSGDQAKATKKDTKRSGNNFRYSNKKNETAPVAAEPEL